MITVIGLGEIGSAIFKELCKKREDIFGVDIDKNKLEELKKQGFKVGEEIPESEIYILAVYLTEQVFDVLNKINFKNKPLVVIEATTKPGTYQKLIDWKKEKGVNFDLVVFPHRYNPNDPEHHVFNLDRIISGEERGVQRALDFYREFMDRKLIHIFPPEIVDLAKTVENAHRFIEIAIAEELKMLCDKKSIDFNKLREACNTKWNIDIKEARDGIGGKCLPKDTQLANEFFDGNNIFDTAIKIDEKYKKSLEEKK